MTLLHIFGLAVALAVATLGPSASRATEIIAHRGASFDAPENTLPAVELAWKKGADAVEADIHLTRDGKIVAIHDYSTKRTAGFDEKVEVQTLEQLKKLDAGRWKDERWAGTKIPTLEEVLAAVPAGKRLFIEIKCGEEVLPELRRVIGHSGKREQVVIIGFSFSVVRAAKGRMPEIPVYWLYGFSDREKSQYGSPSLDDLISKVQSAGLDGLDVRYSGPFDAEFVEKLNSAGMRLYVYTVNSPDEARRLARMGVAGITTDRPAFIREALASAH